MRDDFSDIIPFLAVADRGSFRAAAEFLGVTAAAVSQAIRRLEDEVGVTLLHRTTRSVALSDEGRVYAEHAREALSQVRLARDRIAQSVTQVRGTVTLSLSHIMGKTVVEGLPRLAAAHPGLRLELYFTDQFAHLYEDGVDIALRMGPLRDSNLVSKKIIDTRMSTVASPSYIGRFGSPTSPAGLAEHRCLYFRSPRGQLITWQFRDERDLLFEPWLVTDDGNALIGAATTGLGIAQGFDFLTRAPIKAGRLVPVLDEFVVPGPPIFAVVRPGQQHVAKVRAVLDFLAGVFV